MTDKLLSKLNKVQEEEQDPGMTFDVRLIVYTNQFQVSAMSEQEARDRLLENKDLAITYIQEQGIDQVEVDFITKSEGVPESAEDIKRYQDLAEKLFVVKHLKEQKNITDKQKKFIEETEKIELTDKERAKVMALYGKLLPKAE